MALPVPDSKGKGNKFPGKTPGTITKDQVPKLNSNNSLESFAQFRAFGSINAKRLSSSVSNKRSTINPYAYVKLGQAGLLNAHRLTHQQNSNIIKYAPRTNYGQFTGAAAQIQQNFNATLPQANDYSAMAAFAAKRDTAKTAGEYIYYNKGTLHPTVHNAMLKQGNDWMSDTDSITSWILGGNADGVFYTEEEYNAAVTREAEYRDYMNTYLRDVQTFDPNTNTFAYDKQFTPDAPLPPWIPNTARNNRVWEYYKTYAHDTVQSTADDYVNLREERTEFRKNPYKSAFSDTPDSVNSFLDILIDPNNRGVVPGFKKYVRDYYINPFKGRKFKTLAGNALWNLMDTMDFASRGVRAFTAGETAIGGSGRTVFKGQNEFWVHLDGMNDVQNRAAQELFMRNGGWQLILKDHPELLSGRDISTEDTSMSREELESNLDVIFGEDKDLWREIYTQIEADYFGNNDITSRYKQGLENVKATYSDPAADFSADTGHLATDIITETLLDPGTILGGLTKNISKGGVRTAADIATSDSMRAVLGNADEADNLMRNKKVRSIIKAFTDSNEGRNIIFKDSKKFAEDADLLYRKLKNIDIRFDGDANRQLFTDILTSHLMGKSYDVNGTIINSTNWARNIIDSKTYKAAAWMDRSIDAIDSAIIKSSFAAPWAVFRGVKEGKRLLLSSETVGKYYFIKRLRQAEAARTIRNGVTGEVDATRIGNLIRKMKAGEVDVDAGRTALLDMVHKYDNLAIDINSWTSDFVEGRKTADEIYKLISDAVMNLSGNKYGRVADLVGILSTEDIRYVQDLQNAFASLEKAHDRLTQTVQRLSEAAKIDFLDGVRNANNIDELAVLFREHMDNKTIMGLRAEVLDNVSFPLTESELDEVVAGVENGLFSNDTVTPAEIKKAAKAVQRKADTLSTRSINVHDFHSMLEQDFSDLLRRMVKPGAGETMFPEQLRALLEPSEGTTRFSVDYIYDVIDKSIRKLESHTVANFDMFTGAASGILHQDDRIAELFRLRDAVARMDVVSLQDVEVVTVMHTDRMAVRQHFANSPGIKNLFGRAYKSILAPAINELSTKFIDDTDLIADSIVPKLMRIRELKYGFDRTNALQSEIKSLHGFSDEKLHTVLNGLATNFGNKYGSLQDVLRTPGVLRKNLELTMRSQFGDPKLGMKHLTDMLRSVDTPNLSPYLKDYADELADPEIREFVSSIARKSDMTPDGYVEKQMLSAILMDPSLINTYNKQSPVFFHISTSGLSSELNEITAVSYRKWIPIEVSDSDPLTIAKIKAAFDSGETVTVKRGLSDEFIDSISENNLRHIVDWKGLSSSEIRDEYRKVFGISEDNPELSEADLLNRVCGFLIDESINKETLQVNIPHLVVHDSDGFNIPFFNRKVAEASRGAADDSFLIDYAKNMQLSDRISYASMNTYTHLSDKLGIASYTSEELDQISDILTDYIDDISRYAGDNYDMLDFTEYEKLFRDVVNDSSKVVNAEFQDTVSPLIGIRDSIVTGWKNTPNAADDLTNYRAACLAVSDITIYPKEFVFGTSELDDDLVHTALKATGKDTINVESRVYVRDVLSYFDIQRTDGTMNVSLEALNKMHNMAQYIIRNRDHTIVAGADDFLLRYKPSMDNFINSIVAGVFQSNAYVSTEFEFLRNLKIPDTAVESYLMAQKLYDDYARFWLNEDEILSFTRTAESIDHIKARLKEIRASSEAANFTVRNAHNDLQVELAKEAEQNLAEQFDADMDLLYQNTCYYMNNYKHRLMSDMLVGEPGIGKPGVGLANVTTWYNAGSFEPEMLDILDGAHRPEIFKSAAKSDFQKTVYSYRDGVMREGLDLATKYSEVNSNIKSELRQLNSIDAMYQTAGIRTTRERVIGSMYLRAKQLFDILDTNGFLQRESFQTFLRSTSEMFHMRVRQYRLDMLRTDGVFDRTKLLSELVWNGFNHTVFNSHAYTPAELDELVTFVKDLKSKGDDFLELYEDRATGNIFVALNYNAVVSSGDGVRYINGHIECPKPVRDVLAFPQFDELKDFINLDDIDDFRDVYQHLITCWDDARYLSGGAMNGTSGRLVTRKQAEEYFETLPSGLENMLSPKGMLRSDLARDAVYDPGFVIGEDSDILTDFLDTFSREADEHKETAVIVNEVFNHNGNLQFSDLAENFTDKELMDYFGNNPDYVVATITPSDNTKSGLQIRQLKIDNAASLRSAKQLPNTTILPYDMYFELANNMNRSVTDSAAKNLLGKYLLAYKAFALTKPGTLMRNYIDATTKAAIDSKEGVSGLFSLMNYQSKAAKDMGAYMRILRADSSLLTKSNWEMIQRVFKTDMTFEDFEVLRGIMDSKRFTSADRYFVNKTANRRGMNIISGENIGVRNLDEKDISDAFDKYLATESNLPLSKNDFLDIYFRNVTPDEVIMDQYEDMMRKLSINLRNAEEPALFDKTINNMFKPFGATEHFVRYAQTLQLKDMGLSSNQITKRIHATQFYNAPSWGAWHKLEAIMPFITFKYNNIMFWIRTMEENPRFFKYFEDIYGNIAEDTVENMLDPEQNIDYDTDYALQSGGIPLGDSGYYLNVNNSFLSAINDFYGLTDNGSSLNPLLKVSLKYSLYAFGVNANSFLGTTDMNASEGTILKDMFSMLPGASIATSGYRIFNNVAGQVSEDGGPTMDTLFSTLNFLGILGVRRNYKSTGQTDFTEWQEELEAQGLWFDANTGKIVDISEKNENGANNPSNTFEDVQAYMLSHFGKLWDPNQHKFVYPEDIMQGNFDVHFDFENDPEAWEKLQQWMLNRYGKVYDYNQRAFVLPKDYISGGLNDKNIDFKKKVQLMQEKFGLLWDANQSAFVTPDRYIPGGLNNTKNFNEVKSLRLAMYGQVYNPETKKFEQVQEPMIVTTGDFFKNEEYDNYFSRLGIPRLQNVDMNFHVDREGFLVTDDGRYILTNNPEYNERLFAKFRNLYSASGRSYEGWKNYSGRKLSTANKKPYKGRTLPSTYYTGYGWNDKDVYYRFQYSYNYQYHNPQPGRASHRLLSPRINYPYGGGYNKFSFYTR